MQLGSSISAVITGVRLDGAIRMAPR